MKKLSTIVIMMGVLMCTVMGSNVGAHSIIVAHDVNTFSTSIAGSQEEAFALNVANYLTRDSTAKNLLLFESNTDPWRNFSTGVVNTLSSEFSVTVTSDYTTSFESFDAIFLSRSFPAGNFINNSALINYFNAGGSIYLAGGVGGVGAAPAEAAGWSNFLGHFGLAYDTSWNGLNNVNITSDHQIFQDITSLRSGNGQSTINLGTNSNTHIIQTVGTQGMYAVVEAESQAVPEPSTIALIGSGLFGLLFLRRKYKK